MFVNINGIWLSSERPETYTQAYHAGVLVSMVENFLPDESIPSLPECMVNFHALRELFGDRLWQKLSTRSKFKSRIIVYEKLTYQSFLPRAIIGGSREFCLGYAYHHKKTKLKKQLDLKRTQQLQPFVDYLTESS